MKGAEEPRKAPQNVVTKLVMCWALLSLSQEVLGLC